MFIDHLLVFKDNISITATYNPAVYAVDYEEFRLDFCNEEIDLLILQKNKGIFSPA